jgi:hypothetical protein
VAFLYSPHPPFIKELLERLSNHFTLTRSIMDSENGRHDDLDSLNDPINVAARELDVSRAEALDAIDRAPVS